MKDLSRLGRNIQDIIIIDNSPNSYAFHPQNAFPCISWYEDKQDEELAEFMSILDRLKLYKGDVRKILRKIVPKTLGKMINVHRAIKVLDKTLA